MMLSRTKKSKVMYLGSWKLKATRPRLPAGVEYLQEVQQLKVLGLTLSPSFHTTLKLTWQERIAKFKTACILWSSRSLPTLHQRATAINTYMTNKLSYHASVLPLPKKYQLQLETQVRRFLFRGMIIMGKLKLEELAHPVSEGGIGLVNIQRKCSSLYIKQVMRMLSRRQSGWRHLSYWLHSHLASFTFHERPRALTLPPHQHRYIGDMLHWCAERKSEQELMVMSSKNIYSMVCEDLPEPRLIARNPGVDIPGLVWPRLATATLGVEARFVMFTTVNEVLRNREYMFRVWGNGDPNCDHNPDLTGECAGVPQTIPHLLQTCGRVAGAWEWLLSYMFSHLLLPGSVTEAEFLSMQYNVPKDREDEVTWLLGSYLEYVAREVLQLGRVVGAGELRASLQLKLTTHHMKKLRNLHLPGL